MFKVHEKFIERTVWIRVSEILTVYRVDDDYTVIKFKNSEYLYVTESVEEILMEIQIRETRPRLLHSEV